jgi:hypothetical protein
MGDRTGLSEAKNPAKLKMMKNQLEMMLSELDNYLDSNTVDVEEGMMPRIEALIRDINTLMGDRTGLREMEGSDIKLDVDDDYVEMSSDSGDYDGFIKDNGTISFSVVYDDSEDRDGMDFDDNNWKDILGSNHAFVKIAKSIPTEVETGSDYVMITVKADDLIERFK